MERDWDIATAKISIVVEAIRQGHLSAQEYAAYFLEQLEVYEPHIHSLAYWDAEQVLQQARALDLKRRRGDDLGPLAGIPVAIKDVLDVRNMPTAFGADAVFHCWPTQDAAVVTLLKAAGAIIFGKATTAEFAFAHPPATRNPHNRTRSAGGSSSGSAAGVAAGLFPLAIGTQTGGSIIRPASFCGTYGFKPTFGRLSRQGLAYFAESFDTIGWFGRYWQDISWLYSVLIQADDSGAHQQSTPACLPWKQAVRFAYYRGPYWEEVDASMQALVLHWAQKLGAKEIDLPIDMSVINAHHQLLMAVEMAQKKKGLSHSEWDRLSPSLQQLIGQGQRAPITKIGEAYRYLEWARLVFEHALQDIDVILAPAALGAAPQLGSHTGSSLVNRYWSALHVPCLSLPLGVDAQGMPLGVQLIARRFQDEQLFNAAALIQEHADS